jgi:hypothetical protein
MNGNAPHHRVEEHLAQLTADLRRYQAEAQAAQRELAEAQHRIQELDRPASARIEQLLRAAREQVAEFARAAEEEAGRLRALIRQEADDSRRAAERETDAARTASMQRADEVISAAEREAAAVRGAAERDVAQLRGAAEREARQLRAAANAETGLQPLVLGYRVKEVPISWINRSPEMGTSSFRLIHSGGGYWRVLLGIWLKEVFGAGPYRYLRPNPKPPVTASHKEARSVQSAIRPH